MDEKSLVVGIGELLWDVFPDHKQMGGATSNFAYHMSKFGLKSQLISAVGKDDLGKQLIDNLKGTGINYHLQQADWPTGTVQVSLSGNGIPQYEICQPVAWDCIEMKPEFTELAQQTKAVCFGSLAQRSEVSRNTIRTFVNAVPDSAWKVFDINLRQQFYTEDVLLDSFERCNVLKINDEEIKVVADILKLNGTDLGNCKSLLERFNLKLVALTCGAEGSYLITADKSSFLQTPQVKVADTVGAGDSFTAAMLVGLLAGKQLAEIHQMAVRLSAFVCTQHGAMPEYDPEEFV